MPKILAPVLGRPFLEHLLEWLTRQGAHRVVLSLGYRAEDVLSYLESRSFPGLEIQPAIEPEPLGTGGAVAFARPFLKVDPVLVINGDTIVDVNLSGFVRAHYDCGAEASMLCVQVEDAGRYGRVEIDALGRVFRFMEKDPAAIGPAWINAGFYLFNRSTMEKIFQLKRGSLERDILEQMPRGTIAAFRIDRRFLDIGTPQTLALAAEVLNP
jgi:mannose-1-phosphate guanylyltransferase